MFYQLTKGTVLLGPILLPCTLFEEQSHDNVQFDEIAHMVELRTVELRAPGSNPATYKIILHHAAACHK